MREIKFKLWLASIKKMSYALDIIDWANGYEEITITDNEVWLQYTGLKDKNGKEVYHKDYVLSGKKRFVVEWQQEEARFLLLPTISNPDNWKFMDEVSHMIVDGNVYENKNLSEK